MHAQPGPRPRPDVPAERACVSFRRGSCMPTFRCCPQTSGPPSRYPTVPGPVLVPGAPGTGKSTVLIEAAVRRAVLGGVDPERILILAPGRLAADSLRDRFTARLDRSLSTTPARTWAAYAFDLIRRAKAEGILPLPRAPRLLSGPEQDLIIRELLEGHRIPGLELAVAFGPGSGTGDARFPSRGAAAL